MTAVCRPALSPALRRALPEGVLPIWPALVQRFERVSQTQLMSLRACSSAETQRRVEADEAAALLPLLERSMAEASIEPVYLTLAAAAAHIKVGDVARARTLLYAFAASPTLSATLNAPPRGTHDLLLGAHPLWLVMHVAIEAGMGPQLVMDVLACGLRGRLAVEPELAAGLLLNALKCGDTQTLTRLRSAQVALTPRARMRLDEAVEGFAQELQARAARRVPMPPQELQYFNQRRQALEALGAPDAAQQLLDASGQKVTLLDRRRAADWLRFLPCLSRRNTAPLPPLPRTTAPQ